MKILHVSHDDASKRSLDITLLKKLPLLEDVDISLSYFSDGTSQWLFEDICEACPRLKKLRMSLDVCLDSNACPGLKKLSMSLDVCLLDYGDDMDIEVYREEAYVIPVMSELRSLELLHYNLTAAGLTAIIDSCPLLESLNVTGGYIIHMMDQELRAKCAMVKNLSLPCDSDEDSYAYEEYGPQDVYESDYIYDEFFYEHEVCLGGS